MTTNYQPWSASAPPRRRILLTLLTIGSLVLAQLALTGSTATGTELEDPQATDGSSDRDSDQERGEGRDKDRDKDDRDKDDRDRDKDDKAWVCKLVGQPDDARLSTGKNPIHVSRNATDGRDAFNDAHPSFVVSGPDDPACKIKDDKDRDRDEDRERDKDRDEPVVQKGDLVIKKVTTPEGIEQDFEVALKRGDEVIEKRTLTGDGDSAKLTLPAAKDYRLVEKVPAGWYPDYTLACTIGDHDVMYDGRFKIVAGKTTTCVIENVAIAPTVTVKKFVENRYGGTAGPDDFTLMVNDTKVASSETIRLHAGVEYTVSEKGLDGYELVDIACRNSYGTDHGATFTPEFGDEILCKVMNRDLPKVAAPKPDITLDKHVVGGVVVGDTGDLEVRIKDDEAVKVTYDYVVTNSGEEGLSKLALVDDTLGDLSGALVGEVTSTYGDPILPVGKSVTVTASLKVTPDDFDDGELVNIAGVAGVGVVTKIKVTDVDIAKVVLVEVKDAVAPIEVAPIEVAPIEVAPIEVAPVVPVTPRPPPALPVTGTESSLYTALGLLLAALGTMTLLLTPRRRRR